MLIALTLLFESNTSGFFIMDLFSDLVGTNAHNNFGKWCSIEQEW